MTEADGILADLGVSSHHFDAVERGFSFRGEAPLDMRMNQRGGLTAAKVVNSYPAQTLTQLLGDWGELDTPWKVANCIVRARETAPIQTTSCRSRSSVVTMSYPSTGSSCPAPATRP